MKLKYIMLDDCFPIIFQEALKHDVVAGRNKDRVTSAGHVKIKMILGKLVVTCYGDSLSLGKKPGKHDEHIITEMLEDQK